MKGRDRFGEEKVSHRFRASSCVGFPYLFYNIEVNGFLCLCLFSRGGRNAETVTSLVGHCFLSGRSQESVWGSNCQPCSWEEEAEGLGGERKPEAIRTVSCFSLRAEVRREEGTPG